MWSYSVSCIQNVSLLKIFFLTLSLSKKSFTMRGWANAMLLQCCSGDLLLASLGCSAFIEHRPALCRDTSWVLEQHSCTGRTELWCWTENFSHLCLYSWHGCFVLFFFLWSRHFERSGWFGLFSTVSDSYSQ